MATRPGDRNGLDATSRAHLARIGEILVLPLGADARDALSTDDPDRIAAALAAIEAKLGWINDVLVQLGRRPLKLEEIASEPADVRLRLAVLHIATEVIAGR